MGLPQRKEQIQEYISSKADERFINLVYGMIQAEKESSYQLPQSHKNILDDRLKAHQKDPSEGKSWEEVRSSLLRNK